MARRPAAPGLFWRIAATCLALSGTGDAVAGEVEWQGVGRIDIGADGFCTGALIAPDLVLTAAHCLFDAATGDPVPVEAMVFRAGLHDGRSVAARDILRAAAHPGYATAAAAPRMDRIAVDLALLQLDGPVEAPVLVPFETAGTLRKGAQVTVVSYAENRAAAPLREEGCHVLERYGGVVMLSCAVDFGASGAPIFLFDGVRPRIVSVVVAKAEADGRPVALAGDLAPALGPLRAALDATGQAPSGVTAPGLGPVIPAFPQASARP